MTALLNAEKEFVALAYDVRQKLSDANFPGFSLEFVIGGRTATGELKYEVKLFDEYGYSTASVSGNSVVAVLEEYIRRNSWSKQNEVLMLPSIKSDAVEALENNLPF